MNKIEGWMTKKLIQSLTEIIQHIIKWSENQELVENQDFLEILAGYVVYLVYKKRYFNFLIRVNVLGKIHLNLV